MKRGISLLMVTIFIYLAAASLLKGDPIVGGLSTFNCEGGWCSSSYQWPVVIKGSVAERLSAAPEANYPPYYAGHAFFPDGRSVLLALDDDCKNDGSFEMCLTVALFDPSGSLIKKKTFISTYRQTDPNYLLIEKSFFEVVDVTTWNDKIMIALDYPRSPLLVTLDTDLNVVSEQVLPAKPVALAGPWVMFEDKTLLDLETGKLFTQPFGDQLSRYYVTEMVPLADGVAIFFSAPTGLYLELETPVVLVKREGDNLKNIKIVWFQFENSALSGAPVILKAAKTQSGWQLHLKLWQNFGGEVVHGVILGDQALNNWQFYTIRGAEKAEWNGFNLITIGSLSDRNGALYFPLVTDKAAALVNLSALPLEKKDAMTVISWGEESELYWQPLSEAQLSPSSYITECRDCLPITIERLDLPIGVVTAPTMFYLKLDTADSSVFANLFYYGPPGYKTYCGLILNNQISVYDGQAGQFLPFDPTHMDAYVPLDNADTPKILLNNIKVCDQAHPLFPNLELEFLAVSVPEGLSLSTALENGNFLLSVIPWKAPDCH